MTTTTDNVSTVRYGGTEVSASPVGALLIFLVTEANGPEQWQLAEWACAEHDIDATDLESAVSEWHASADMSAAYGEAWDLEASECADVVECLLVGV